MKSQKLFIYVWEQINTLVNNLLVLLYGFITATITTTNNNNDNCKQKRERRRIRSNSHSDSYFNNNEDIYTRPKRIILVRHGESLGNVNELMYTTTPDWKIGLTDHGKNQAKDAGKQIAKLCSGEPLITYVSPYNRAMETWNIMKDILEKDIDDNDIDDDNENEKTKERRKKVQLIGTRQEPRISEQQFGNFQNVEQVQKAKKLRQQFGRFFYRFPDGEAGMDVYNRVSSFLQTLFRDFDNLRTIRQRIDPILMFNSTRSNESSSLLRSSSGQEYCCCKEGGLDMEDTNILIVTHGLTLRLFLMRYFSLNVEEFEKTYNPPNGQLIIMNRYKSNTYGWEYYKLSDESAKILNCKGDVSTESPVLWRQRSNS